MIYNKIVTNDNHTITSENLMNLTVTWETNSETNIKPGSCVSTMVSGEVVGDYTDWENVTNFTLYSTHDSDLTNATWTTVGVFYVQNVKPTGKNRFSIEAYDAISKLEVNVANFVYSNWVQSWASLNKTVFQLVSAVCTQCGVTAEPITTDYHFPTIESTNTDTVIISLEGLSKYDDWTTATITGRQVVSWLAELCGCYVVINPETNKLQFSWYDTDNLSWQRTKYSNVYDEDQTLLFQNVCDVISSSSEDTFTFDSTSKHGRSYKQGSLTFDRYTVDNEDFYAVVDKDDGTYGYYYPRTAEPGDSNPKYMISDNRFICGLAINDNSTEATKIRNLALLVRRCQAAVSCMEYKPFSTSLFPISNGSSGVLRGFCGFPVGVIDYSGNKFKTIITKCVRSVSGLTISATGEEAGGVYQTSGSSAGGSVNGKVVIIEYDSDAQTAWMTLKNALKAQNEVVLVIKDEEEGTGIYNRRYAVLYNANWDDETGDGESLFVEVSSPGSIDNGIILYYLSKSGNDYEWDNGESIFGGGFKRVSFPTLFSDSSTPDTTSVDCRQGDLHVNTANGDLYHCISVTKSGLPATWYSTWEKIGNTAGKLPTGGTSGQVLSKVDGTDYNVQWSDAGSGGTSNFNELTNRPSYNGTTMTGDTSIPEVKTSTWDAKQDALVSGTNIKTINNQSLLGSGDISISASVSYPLITVASSQVTQGSETVIQFTNEQAAIIENSDNAIIVIDLLSIDYSRLVFERNLETNVSTGTINLIAKESYKLNVQLTYTRSSKSAVLTEFFVADEDDLTGHTEDTDIHVTTANKTTWNNKQDALVSGTSIKTVNGVNILGSGNIPAIPTGGTVGQVLAKIDGTDYNTQWVNQSGGSSIPVITVDSSQQSGNEIQFTAAQAAILEDSSNEIVVIDMSYGEIQKLVYVRDDFTELVANTYAFWSVFEHLGYDFCHLVSIGYNSQTKIGTISTMEVADGDTLTSHINSSTIHVTSSDKTNWNGKQDELVSGTNIKTVNGQSLLDSGNIQAIPSGGAAGQILSKVDGTDYNTEWINQSQASHGIPSGGSAGQVLTKVDGTDYNATWSTSPVVTSWSATPLDTNYPSEKLVYDTIGDVSDLLDALLNGVS